MTSSIFKSICAVCAAAVLLASPAAARFGNWDIIYQSLDTNFSYSATNKITMKYLIGTGRTFKVDLFDKGCTNSITGATLTPIAARMPDVSTDYDQLEITMDLDTKSEITSSNIWSSPNIEFCVRVQLQSNGDVINTEKLSVSLEPYASSISSSPSQLLKFRLAIVIAFFGCCIIVILCSFLALKRNTRDNDL